MVSNNHYTDGALYFMPPLPPPQKAWGRGLGRGGQDDNSMADLNPNAHWRDSARAVRFFGVDYRAMFPLLICLFLPRLWTLGLAVAAIVFFTLLERYGFSVMVFARALRGFFAGPRKIATPWWLKKYK